MGSILQSLTKTIHLSIVLAVLLFIYLFYAEGGWAFDQLFWSWLFRYFHVLSGVMWIGLLWYLNFIQIPKQTYPHNSRKNMKISKKPSPKISVDSQIVCKEKVNE